MYTLINVKEYNKEVESYGRTLLPLFTTKTGLKKLGWVHIVRRNGTIVGAQYYKNKKLALDSIAILERIPF